MVNINLLSWRQSKYDYQQKILKQIIVASVAIVFLIAGARYAFLVYQVDEEIEKVTFLQQQIDQLSNQSGEQNQYAQIEKIKTLQFQDIKIKSLFLLLGRSYEENVCFTSISRNQSKLSFVGRTRSPADLTHFLRTWSAGDLFADVQIVRLERDAKPNMFFHFQANL